jgi:UDP-N-acetylmuramyl pentapeptide phosphotransferase/UDP-N-acetylglucosamine-1-phosphate transferase
MTLAEYPSIQHMSPPSLLQVMLGVFASNSINILAGVNGLEAGQTLIIACAVLLHNLMQVGGHRPMKLIRLCYLECFYSDTNLPLQESRYVLVLLLQQSWMAFRLTVGPCRRPVTDLNVAI